MEDRTHYSFKAMEFIDNDISREMYHSIYVDGSANWVEVLRAFTDFMTSVYGYSLDNQIIITKHNHLTGEQEETLLRDYF